MTDPLDSRLRALFRSLDTSAGFDEAVLARIKVESAALSTEAIRQAELAESRRYQAARGSLSWTYWIRRLVTLETVGSAVLASFALRLLWVRLSPLLPVSASQYVPEVLACAFALAPMALALGIALIPATAKRRLSLA
jgi:hypothetical protein